MADACFCKTERAKESCVRRTEANGGRLILKKWSILLNYSTIVL